MAQNWARYIRCIGCGNQHFGAGGAAGVLLVRRDYTRPGHPATHVILQHRANTRNWAIPGGFRDNGETYRQTALREAWEEISLPRNCTEGANPLVVIRREVTLLDHVSWRYTTFIADVMGPFEPRRPPGDTESLSVNWVPIDQVGVRGGRFFPLLPSFWEGWDQLLRMVREMDGQVQVPQSVQVPQPVQVVLPAPPPAVYHDPATPPENTGSPSVWIVEDDEDGEEDKSAEGFRATEDKKEVPSEPQVPQVVLPAPPPPVYGDPVTAPENTGSPSVWIVEDDEEEEENKSAEVARAAGDKEVPSEPQVPPEVPPQVLPQPPAVESDTEEELAFMITRLSGRRSRERGIGYMTWDDEAGSRCQAS